MMDIQKELLSLGEQKYKDFQSALMPTVDPDTIIGIRTPILRRYAKTLKDTTFLEALPHRYYEENNLHSFLIAGIADYDECIAHVERFLPFVDNWATCDSLRPACFKKHRQKLILKVKEWLGSNHTYTVRFGIEMLMVYYLDDEFDDTYPKMVADIKSDEYYVNMMIAWYFATALAKKWESIIGYIEKCALPLWVHNKTIQKAIESYRITNEQKDYLRKLKRR